MSTLSYIFWICLVAFIVVISCAIICNADTNTNNVAVLRRIDTLTMQERSNIVRVCDKAIKELEQLKKENK